MFFIYMWVKKYVKICVMLFKMLKSVFKLNYQNILWVSREGYFSLFIHFIQNPFQFYGCGRFAIWDITQTLIVISWVTCVTKKTPTIVWSWFSCFSRKNLSIVQTKRLVRKFSLTQKQREETSCNFPKFSNIQTPPPSD